MKSWSWLTKTQAPADELLAASSKPGLRSRFSAAGASAAVALHNTHKAMLTNRLIHMLQDLLNGLFIVPPA
jgi:hypothetical protein